MSVNTSFQLQRAAEKQSEKHTLQLKKYLSFNMAPNNQKYLHSQENSYFRM